MCQTFREACSTLGLLEDDVHWDHTLEDAAVTQSPEQMRNLFAIMIAMCALSNAQFLWEKHADSLAEDFLRVAQRSNPRVEMNSTIANKALLAIEDKVLILTQRNLEHFGLTPPNRSTEKGLL